MQNSVVRQLKNIFKRVSGLPTNTPQETNPAGFETSIPDKFADAPQWDRLPGAQCIREWAGEIIDALQGRPNALPWPLVGYAALLQVDDQAYGESILRRLAAEAGMNFVATPSHDVARFFAEKSMPFAHAAPQLIYLENGIWMAELDEATIAPEKMQEIRAIRHAIRTGIEAFDPERPRVFVTTTHDLNQMSSDLRHPDYFSRRFEIRPLAPEELAREFLAAIEMENIEPGLLDNLGALGEFVECFGSPRRRQFQIQALRRLALKERRRINFGDIVRIGHSGTVETDPIPPYSQATRQRVAIHEAGHAAIAILDSGGQNIPDYLTINPTTEGCGISVNSYGYESLFRGTLPYRKFCHEIRVRLGGRGAEEIFYGAEYVDQGAQEDLRIATGDAIQAFSRYGFAPAMAIDGRSSSNLAVVGQGFSTSEAQHVEALTREFLATEYQHVIRLLHEHRPLMDLLVSTLIETQVLYQGDLQKICDQYDIEARCLRNSPGRNEPGRE